MVEKFNVKIWLFGKFTMEMVILDKISIDQNMTF